MELNNLKYSFNNIKLDSLKFHQQQELVKLLNQFLENNQISPITQTEDLHCPHCASYEYVKNGMRKGKQKYKCKKCSLSFTLTSNSSLHYVKKIDIWVDFVYLMLKSHIPPTIKELALKLNISTKTAHEWKHKLLAGLNELDALLLSREIEMDEVFIPFCVKGRKGYEKSYEVMMQEDMLMQKGTSSVFLCVHNRQKDFDFLPIKIQQKGAIGAEFLRPVIESLDIKPNTIVITDKGTGSTSYFKERTDVIHKTFISSADKEKNSTLHNNNINSTMALFWKWSDRFRGFSTKYVWNYLKWFRFHRLFLEYSNLDSMVSKSVKDERGFVRYVMIRKYYEKFLFTA